jgi:hypothetical protein
MNTESSSTMPWITGLTASFVLLLIVVVTCVKTEGGRYWLAWRRIWTPPRLNRRKQLSIASQHTIECNVPLQTIRPGRRDDEEEEAPIATQVVERAPTPFARRGRLPAEQ